MKHEWPRISLAESQRYTCLEDEDLVHGDAHLLHELFADTILKQLLRVELNDAHQRGLHVQNTLREDRHLLRYTATVSVIA